jgi:hypothetical protein
VLRNINPLPVRVIESDEDRAQWEQLLESHPMGRAIYPMYFLASQWKPLPIGIFHRDKIAGGLLAATKKMGHFPLNLSRILVAMVGRENPREMLDGLLFGMEDYARKQSVIETDVQLRLPATGEVEGRAHSELISEVFEKHGYHRLPRADKTFFIRIDKNDDALLASFGQQPRNRIKKAQKDGAEVFISRDPSLLDLFYESYRGTADRKHMPIVLERVQLVEGMKPLLENGRALIFAERYGETISNMIIVDPLGTPCVMLASRTKANVEGRVPSCAQIVHFEAMKRMRDRGAKYYDFGGCEGPVPIESHPNWGVWHFKWGFKGAYVTFLPHLRKIRGDLTQPLLNLLHRFRGDAVSVNGL